MADVATLEDIFNALENADFDFAAGLLKDNIFNQPDDPRAWQLLARYFIDIEMGAFAYPVARAAAQVDPCWQNLMILGAAEGLMQKPEASEKSLRQALKKMKNESPKNKAMVYRLMASAGVQSFNFDRAEHYAKKSLAIESHHQAHSALGFAKLHQREWTEGWYHYSFQLGQNAMRVKHDYGLPDWNGEEDARLLVYGDQGLGDQIAYMSAIDKHFISQINCHPKLEQLFRRSFPEVEVHGDMFKREYDWDLKATHQVSMATAMRWSQMQRRGRYLEPLREKVLQWSGLLASKSRNVPRVGIAWTGGNVGSDGFRTRNLTLDQLEPILRMPFQFVSLEYKDRTEEIEAFKTRTGIEILDWHWATITNNYEDTAALVESLDYVITVPTPAYHLGGALGKPTCVIVHDTPHFHEGTFGPSPWWSSVELIRRADFKNTTLAVAKAAEWLFATQQKEAV